MNHKSMAVLVCPMGSEDTDSWDFAARLVKCHLSFFREAR